MSFVRENYETKQETRDVSDGVVATVQFISVTVNPSAHETTEQVSVAATLCIFIPEASDYLLR
jgi:hypothetical protein